MKNRGKIKNRLGLFIMLLVMIPSIAFVNVSAAEDVRVTFITNNSADLAPQSFDKGGNANLEKISSVMEKDGYTFGGWYTDEACSEGKEFTEDTIVNEDIKIYAKWIKNSSEDVMVTFITNSSADLAPQSFNKGGNADLEKISSVMEKDGYTFGGWYTDEACSEGKEFTEDTVVNEDIKIYAKWIKSLSK